MTTASTRRVIWNGLLDVSRQVRYYGELSSRYSQRNTWILFGLIFCGSGEALLILSKASAYLSVPFALAIAAIAAWAVAGDYAKKAAVAHSICLECSYLEMEWESLWNRIDSADFSDDSVLKSNQELWQRLIAATSRATPGGIHEDRKLNEKCWAETCAVLEQQYV